MRKPLVLVTITLWPGVFFSCKGCDEGPAALEANVKSLIVGKEFVSRQGVLLGHDSDSEISFTNDGQVKITEFGHDVTTFTGAYKIDISDKSVNVRLSPHRDWPVMLVRVENGQTLLSRKDGLTARSEELREHAIFRNYWPFAHVKETK